MKEKTRILIIDDDKDTLETLGDILQEKGYQTETAKNGKEAIAKAVYYYLKYGVPNTNDN